MLLDADRADAFMRRYDIDAVVATSPAGVTYLSDYYCSLDAITRESMFVPGGSSERALLVFAVLPVDGPSALVIPSIFAPNAVDSWVRDLYVYGEVVDPALQPHPTAAAALVQALLDRGLGDARVGLEREGLHPGAARTLADELPRASLRDCSSLLRLIRAVKSEDELARLRRSTEIAEEAVLAALAEARPGGPTDSVAASFRRQVAERDADVDHLAFGLEGRGIAMQPRYRFRAGDVMYVDYGCLRAHCFSDAGLTLALREPSPELVARYDGLRECVAAGAELLRPGRRASAVWEAVRGHADDGTLFSGHGIGLEVRELPLVVPPGAGRIRDDCVDEPGDLELEAGMVVNLEASIFDPGVASLHVERTFVVADAGGAELVAQDRTAPFIPSNER